MKTKLFTIAIMVAFIMTTMMKVQAQNFEGPCLPSMHGLDDHQSAFCGSTVTQTIALSAGWNWFSMYIDMNEVDGLTMLEQALGDNAEMIKSKTLVDEFDGEEWYRDGDMALTNEEMFMIYAVNACTVTLEGLVANPAEHQIAINPGWNWIGYPCDEEVAINVALSGFEPEDGDAIKCYNNIAEADGGEWYADGEEMETLKPGQGYMYYSNSSQPKTLIFSTTAGDKSVFLRK